MSSGFIYGTRIIAPLLLSINSYPAMRLVLNNSVSASLWAITIIGMGYLVAAGAEQLFGKVMHIEQLLLTVLIIMLGW